MIGVGLGATAVAAMEQGTVDAAIMLDPAVTLLQSKDKDLKILSDTRTQKDTLDVFGGEYPGGALYTRADWIATHPKEVQALTNAIVSTLKWIHSHTPEEIGDKMPAESGRQGQGALSRGAEEHDPDVFGDRPHGPEGRAGRARRVQPVLARCGQGQHRPVEDLHQQLRRRGQQEDGNEVGRRRTRSRRDASMAGSFPAMMFARRTCPRTRVWVYVAAMNILSIQSHVAFGHVGNAAATFPLQRLGIEVWPIHTVQFSNHTGYGSWNGRVFDAGMIREVVAGHRGARRAGRMRWRALGLHGRGRYRRRHSRRGRHRQARQSGGADIAAIR